MTLLWNAAALVAAYLIGSLSFAVIVSRFMGLSDPRSYGSGNPGATNVLRSGNKKAAALTLLFDLVKGLVPVALVVLWGHHLGLDETSAAWVGLAAFLGHLWPVFFRFQGGKGVATAAGVLLGLNPLLGGVVLLTWLMVAYFTRYSSLAALIAAAAAPVIHLVGWGGSGATVALLIMSGLLIWRHQANISKLLAGTESRIGQKTGSTPPSDAGAAPAATQPAAKRPHHSRHHPKRKSH
ncbi:MAG: glycerol-3-phosphate 1-O-acyltransferase PlsY [Leptothrix sp. (in: Bacteria)]|nr:glycerol-3-phosphate 1-O-acyltransferase PlsY [Leptothrix sp. (in: b-proteobacteria)]